MQNIHIISVGKLVKDLLSRTKEYQKMIRFKVNITEITYSQKLPEGQIKQFEGRKISEHLSKDSFKIVLDVKGKELSSHEFSNLIVRDRKIDFIIGGAYGLDQMVLDIADFKLSLSRMTFPHQIAKLLLLEQIYRAQTILENHPYHK